MSHVEQVHEKICNLLNREFTKEFLVKSWLPLVSPVVKGSLEALRKNKVPESLLPKEPDKHAGKTKLDVLHAVALLFATPDTYLCFRENLSEETRTLWDAVVFNDYVSFKLVEETYGFVVQAPDTNHRYYHDTPEVRLPFRVIPCKQVGWSYSYRQDSYFYLPLLLRKFLVGYYKVPEWARLTKLDALPEGCLFYTDAEEKFVSEFYRLQLYYKQGRINYTAKLRPVPNGLSRMRKTVRVSEFFPDTDVARHKLVRTNMLASVMPFLTKLEQKSSQPHEILRDFFQNAYRTYFPAPPAMLPDIKGLAYIGNGDLEPFGEKMLSLLKAFPADGYVPIRHILGYCQYNLIEMEPINRYEANNRLSFERGGGGVDSLVGINYYNYRKTIQLPLIRGSFFFFAALGLCELAYTQVDGEDIGDSAFSAWDGLLAVKRTPLGDYVCGLTATYQPADTTSNGLILSDDALLIKIDSPDSPYADMLDVFATRIGPLAFRTDPHAFLKGVVRKEDLHTKIELFRQMVPGKMPGNWEDFFLSLRNKVDPLKLQSGFFVFQVEKENQELIRLLARDPVVKSLISKAEGYQVIVAKKDYAALCSRLLEFGYLQT